MKKIGLLGGTFDPIHNGHLTLAIESIKKLGLEQIIFIPNYQSPFKIAKISTPTEDRIKMLKLAIQDYPQFSYDDIEMKEQKIYYTYQTVEYFKQKYSKDELYFLAGSDILNSLKQWKNFEQLIQKIKFIIAPRNNISIKQIEKHPILLEFPNYFSLLDTPFINISSTQIRTKQINILESSLIPPKVAEYIYEKKLYQ